MKKYITYAVYAWICIGTACNSTSVKKENTGGQNSKENPVLITGETPSGKYQIKSGTYKTKAQNTVMSAGIDSYTLVSFDDYGKKELTETVTKVEMAGIKQETHNYGLMLGDMIYNWDANSKNGTKYNISSMLKKNVDYEKLSDELKKQYKYQELGTETILGKECKKVSVEVSPGAAAIVHTYKGIPMRSEASVGGMKVITEVTELDENAVISASSFEVPTDITFTEMTMPGK